MDEYYLDALTREDCEAVRQWRNLDTAVLRTPFLLTREMQADFYDRIVCNRKSQDRFWAARPMETVSTEHVESVVRHESLIAAMTGLTGIQWENGLAEISLIVSPRRQGKGAGRASVRLVLEEAFLRMRLETVVGECYECNPAMGFWEKVVQEYGGFGPKLPRRKMWDGKLWDAWLFNVTREGFMEARKRWPTKS